MTISCDQARELCSARLDGEASAAELADLDLHLAGCVDCRAFAADAGVLHSQVRLAPAPAVPDLTGAIMAATSDAAPRHRTRDTLRLGLVAIGLVQLLFAIPALFAGQNDVADGHVQHLAAFDLALAIGFLWVAWRPSRARAGFLPIATVLVAVCLLQTGSDLAHGHDHTLRVFNHVLAIVGLLMAYSLRDRPETHTQPALQLAA